MKTKAAYLALILIIIVLCIIAIPYFNRNAKIRWAKEEALPEIKKLHWKVQGISARFDETQKDFVQSVLSSFISSLTKTAAKMTVMTNRAMPPRGFATSQLMIGAITYAVINKAAENMITRSTRIVNTSLIFSTFNVPICYDCSYYKLMCEGENE